MQAFIDDSVEQGRVLVLAGYISTAEKWAKFSNEWQSRLDHAGWSRFKMAEIATSQRPEVSGWFYRAIEDHVEAFVAVAVDITALKQAVDEVGVRPRDRPGYLENPYVMAFRAIQDFTIQHQHELGITEPIDFIFDERGEEKQVREGYEIFREFCRDDLKPLIGRAPRFESDDDFLPLQAADLLAWHVRRHWLREQSLSTEIEMSWQQVRVIRGLKLSLDYVEITRFLMELKDRLIMVGAPSMTLKVTFSSKL